MDKFICIAKNYTEHAREMGDPVPEAPVFFLKPPSSQIEVKAWKDCLEVEIPKNHGSVHYECEILARINETGSIEAVSLGLDMTLRELQGSLKKKGHPWELAKVFRHSAVVGPWIQISEFSDYLDHEFTFTLDGKLCQRGVGREMRFSPRECLNTIQEYLPICKGDVLFTGTPAGVGPVQAGQIAELRWNQDRFYQVRFV